MPHTRIMTRSSRVEKEPYQAPHRSIRWTTYAILLTGIGLICILTEGLLFVALFVAQIVTIIGVAKVLSRLRDLEGETSRHQINGPRWCCAGLVLLGILLGFVAPVTYMFQDINGGDFTPFRPGSSSPTAVTPTSRAPLPEILPEETAEPVPSFEDDVPVQETTPPPEDDEPPAEDTPDPVETSTDDPGQGRNQNNNDQPGDNSFGGNPDPPSPQEENPPGGTSNRLDTSATNEPPTDDPEGSESRNEDTVDKPAG